jgi:hypothetical protein
LSAFIREKRATLEVKKVCSGWTLELAKVPDKYWLDWNNETSMSVLLSVYKDFDLALLKLLSKASPDSLKAWELLDMDVLPTWTDKRLTLLGDAAHPFLPREYIIITKLHDVYFSTRKY